MRAQGRPPRSEYNLIILISFALRHRNQNRTFRDEFARARGGHDDSCRADMSRHRRVHEQKDKSGKRNCQHDFRPHTDLHYHIVLFRVNSGRTRFRRTAISRLISPRPVSRSKNRDVNYDRNTYRLRDNIIILQFDLNGPKSVRFVAAST